MTNRSLWGLRNKVPLADFKRMVATSENPPAASDRLKRLFADERAVAKEKTDE